MNEHTLLIRSYIWTHWTVKNTVIYMYYHLPSIFLFKGSIQICITHLYLSRYISFSYHQSIASVRTRIIKELTLFYLFPT